MTERLTPVAAPRPVEPSSTSRTDGTGGLFLSSRVLAGVPWAVLSKSSLFGCYFLLSVVLVRGLGAESYGIYALCRSIAQYLAVACALGLNTGIVRFVPELVVSRNRAGLRRLLGRSAALQAAAAATACLLLLWLTPQLAAWFDVEFGNLLLLVGVLVSVQLGKDFISDTLTAVFEIRILSILTVVHAVLWVAILAAMMLGAPSTAMAFGVQIGAGLFLVATGGWALARHLGRLDWRSPPRGIGRRRALAVSLPSLANMAINQLTQRQTEIFFLGVYATSATVGLFDLAYSVPLMVITLLPMSVQKLMTSGMAGAYSQDEDSLGPLVAFAFRMLILLVAPVATLGFALGSPMVRLVYGQEMAAAGPLAAMFFLIHSASLFYVPLSMAVIARERILQMLPLTVLQLAVKLLLDWLLISRWGVLGAVAAVAGAFVLTLPAYVWAARRLIGGVYFPGGFFLRVSLVATAAAVPAGLAGAYGGLPGLLAAALLGPALYLTLVRACHLISRRDVAMLPRRAGGRADRLLHWLMATESAAAGAP